MMKRKIEEHFLEENTIVEKENMKKKRLIAKHKVLNMTKKLWKINHIMKFLNMVYVCI